MSAVTYLSGYLVTTATESPIYGEALKIHSRTLYIPQCHLKLTPEEVPEELPKDVFRREITHLQRVKALTEVRVASECLEEIIQLHPPYLLALRSNIPEDITDLKESLTAAVENLYTTIESEPN